MPLRAISIQVSDTAARVYQNASPEERSRLDALLTLRLTAAGGEGRSLEAVMDDLGHKARARGLTPERLDEILNDVIPRIGIIRGLFFI